MIQDIQDEILDTSGQLDTNARYRIRSNDGTILQDDVQIELKTPIIQEGTPLNKATFNNLQGDLYAVDRYNTLTFATEIKPVDYVTDTIISEDFKQDDIIPKTWQETEEGKYTANGITMWETTETGSVTSGREILYAFDGDSETYYQRANSSIQIIIQFPKPIKLTKIKWGTYGWYERAVLKGSNDNTSWTTVLDTSDSDGQIVEEVITSPDFYQCYQIYVVTSSDSRYSRLFEFQTLEYYEREYGINVYNANLSLPLTSYETGKKICVKSLVEPPTDTIQYLDINNLGTKQINKVLAKDLLYTLIYNGESWDVVREDYVTGTYTGDGNATQTISLDFEPSAVIVTNDSGMLYEYSGSKDQYYGGIALKGVPAQYSSDINIVEIVENGFAIIYNSTNRIYANNSGKVYKYIAFK